MFGQALHVQREFSGVMTKPWRMVALHVGSWITLGLIWRGNSDPHLASLTILDWTLLAVIVGCIETLIVRLRGILRSLREKPIRRRVTPMSPDAALNSDVFKIYLAILLGMLAIAGAAIGVLGLILKKDVTSRGDRIAVGW